MIHIQLPETLKIVDSHINKEELTAIFEKGGKYPSIKEQLILKAYEISNTTKMIYDSKELTILSSEDETGKYLSLFNKIEEEIRLELPLSALELEEKCSAYCVLTAEDIDVSEELLRLLIPAEGILLVKLTPEA